MVIIRDTYLDVSFLVPVISTLFFFFLFSFHFDI